MAVTITALELAAALRIGDGTTALIEPQASILNRLLGAATAMIGEYVPDLDNPDVENEAVVRVAGYLYDSSPVGNRRFADVLALSGAQGILAPFRVQRALALDGTEPDMITEIRGFVFGDPGTTTFTAIRERLVDTGLDLPDDDDLTFVFLAFEVGGEQSEAVMVPLDVLKRGGAAVGDEVGPDTVAATDAGDVLYGAGESGSYNMRMWVA